MCTIAPPAPAGTSSRMPCWSESSTRHSRRSISLRSAWATVWATTGHWQANGPQTAAELAAATGTNERYTREWLEQQAVTGILDVALESAAPNRRTYRLRPEYADVLIDPVSLSAGAPMARIFTGAVAPFDQLVEAYRTGAGVPYESYGIDLLEGQAGMNRPQFEHGLAAEWIPRCPISKPACGMVVPPESLISAWGPGGRA